MSDRLAEIRDEDEQRRIWESRCPVLLAEFDAVQARLAACEEDNTLIREAAEQVKKLNASYVERLARLAKAEEALRELALNPSWTHDAARAYFAGIAETPE